MKFDSELTFGRLLRRYKRFLADVRLESGEEVIAHCANPGSMKTCIEPGAGVWLSRSSAPRRRLPLTLEVVELGGVSIYVNPVRVNRVVEEALREGWVSELSGYSSVSREVPFAPPSEATPVDSPDRSRVDFRLGAPGSSDCYVEVKNVTLDLGAGRSAFPDAVTRRGARHLEQLSRVSRRGERAVLLYCASRSDARSVEAAVQIDPDYAQALDRARAAGVEVLAYRVELVRARASAVPEAVRLTRSVEVR